MADDDAVTHADTHADPDADTGHFCDSSINLSRSPRRSLMRTRERLLVLCAALCAACVFPSCAGAPRATSPVADSSAPANKRYHFVGKAMGAQVDLTIDAPNDELGQERARAAARAALLELDRLDTILSDWKRGSEVTTFNRSRELRRTTSVEFRAVLLRALDVAHATSGLFDPTAAPSVALWRESRASLRLPSTAARDSACALVDWRQLGIDGDAVTRTNPDVTLDFGGIGKGYGAIRALQTLREQGCPRALVAVAGDIAAGDAPSDSAAWKIEIVAESMGVSAESVPLVNAAISTSGGSIQWVEINGARYSHIVDPRTGLGATNPAQVTVIGPLDCAVDALGTALALTTDNREAATILAKFPGYRARIERDGMVAWIGANALEPGSAESR